MSWEELLKSIRADKEKIRRGGSEKGHLRQKELGRLSARERVKLLLDEPGLELGLYQGWGMYEEGLPAAGVITEIGPIEGRLCMVIANDATVKAGAFYPQTVKKVLRAQKIAYQWNLPIVYLVDSSGVYLPMQDEIFPDEDDFGRIFRNNSVLSALGLPQFAAIMGNCIAGGGYLPVLCDQLLMTEGSGLYLAGPQLVEAAIGQKVDVEELGGARMHAEISGTVDYILKDDESCLKKLRELISYLPEETFFRGDEGGLEKVYDIVSADNKKMYDVKELIGCIFDQGSFAEYKEEWGKTLVCGFAKIAGHPVGIVATQRARTETGEKRIEIGGVLYTDSANKGARFVMECNQIGLPLVFLQDVMGFMVGTEAEQGGIIKAGAKLVNAISNSVVPKFTVIIGNSFGAGNYALCGKAYDPDLIVAWPNARFAVMGANQAESTIKDSGLKEIYEEQMDIRYGAARGWVDGIIDPKETRKLLSFVIPLGMRKKRELHFHTGVLQV